MAVTTLAEGVEILDVITPAYAEILTPDAMKFLGELDLRELRELRDELEIVHRLQRILVCQLSQDDLQQRIEGV